MNIIDRSAKNLDLAAYKDASNEVWQLSRENLIVPDDQYILRMMIRNPDTNGFVIPKELEWLENTIRNLDKFQQVMFRNHPFVYVTVRSGEVKSVTDDMWHVDGFSMRVPHKPEQNYIWSDCYPTELLNQEFNIPDDFDPLKHNLHTYFQDNADPTKIYSAKEKHICVIDPYIVHRRPSVPVGTKRCFFRVSFVPVEIEDDTCTPNPLLPAKVYGRQDVRKLLIPYETNLQNTAVTV